jgi:aspartyl-tRNA(Asn)/glutamyl-tRNA(Gln) amidotransferase subunit A
MNNDDLCFTSAVDLAALIRDKQISPVEVTDAAIARVERLNPVLNAFCHMDFDCTREVAKEAEAAVARGDDLGPLHGVPFSIKDMVAVDGMKMCSGSNIFADRVMDFDAPLVARLKQAGGVLLGKTTTPEFGWRATGDSPLTGSTRNPWNTDRTSGGSSAGAAASAAAGLAPLNQGADGAGSVRIPAGFCGIFGHKPTFGRVPNVPQSNNDNTSHPGPMTRTVADAALMLSIMAGPDPRDNTSLEAPPADYPGQLNAGIKGLKVAFSPDLGRNRVDFDVAAAVAQAAGQFEDLGAHVEQVAIDWPDTAELIHFMWSAHEVGNYGPYLDEWRDRMDPGLVACIEDAQHPSAADYVQKRAQKQAFNRRVADFFLDYDLLLTPTTSVTALPVGQLNPADWPQHDWNWLSWASFSYPFNFSGNPAASIPIGFDEKGLPIGLQVVGKRFADLTVLQAAAAFEAAYPWAQLRPSGVA